MATEPAVILFDGVCNFCNASVNFVMKRDPKGRFRFAPLQSDVAGELLDRSGLNRDDIDSIVLVEGDRAAVKSTATLRIVSQLTGLWPLLSVFRFVPRFLRDAVYDWIARNRYRWFGRRDSCMLPTAELRGRFLEVSSEP